MFSLIVYTHMVVCIALYCILASPFFLIAGIFCLLTGRPFSVAVLKFIRTFGCFMIRCWYSVYVPVRLDDFSGGADHGIFIVNHRSSSDPFLVSIIPAAGAAMAAAKGWALHMPFFGVFARMGGFIDVNNLTYEEIVDQTRRALSNSGTIYVFPEGTRSGSRTMAPFHSAFFRAAKELNAPLIPVAIAGNEASPDRSFRMRPSRVIMRVLKPIPQERIASEPHFRIQREVHRILEEETAALDREIDAWRQQRRYPFCLTSAKSS